MTWHYWRLREITASDKPREHLEYFFLKRGWQVQTVPNLVHGICSYKPWTIVCGQLVGTRWLDSNHWSATIIFSYKA